MTAAIRPGIAADGTGEHRQQNAPRGDSIQIHVDFSGFAPSGPTVADTSCSSGSHAQASIYACMHKPILVV
jgi:hypothetical protein